MRKTIPFSVLVIILTAFAYTASAQKARFVGSFVAEDPTTAGITRVTLYGDDTINVWGRCHPTDCDWGPESVTTYAAGVGDDLAGMAKALSAVYVHRHAVTILVIKPLKGDRLAVDTFTRFTDGSGRTAYNARHVMVREGSTP